MPPFSATSRRAQETIRAAKQVRQDAEDAIEKARELRRRMESNLERNTEILAQPYRPRQR